MCADFDPKYLNPIFKFRFEFCLHFEKRHRCFKNQSTKKTCFPLVIDIYRDIFRFLQLSF